MTRPTAPLPAVFALILGGVILLAPLLQIASGTPLWSEIGPLSIAQALLLGLLSLPCAALAFQVEGEVRSRLLWGAASATLAATALVQLGILVFEALPERPLFEYPTVAAWGAAAMALLLMQRLARRFERGRAFVRAGFALQSVALLADFADGGGLGLTLVSLRLLGSAEELVEVLVLASYLAGLTLVAADGLADALGNASGSGASSLAGTLRAAFSPSGAYIDRRLSRRGPAGPGSSALFLHAVYRHTRWRTECFSPQERARLLGEIAAWPLIVGVTGIRYTLANGGAIARRSGKRVIQQFGEQLMLAFGNSIAPRAYYMFELYLEARRRHAGDYLQRFETKRGVYRLIKRGKGVGAGGTAPSPLNDKAEFIDWCRNRSVPVVPYVLVLERGVVARSTTAGGMLPEIDLFAKPNNGKGGKGAEMWSWQADGTYAGANGEVLTARALLQRFETASAKSALLVQPSVANHCLLADLNLGALTTVRVVTCRNNIGAIEATNAAMRVARGAGSVVDNFHAGGLAARVDIASGVLGRATDMGVRPEVGWWSRHPANGAPIAGRRLPCWPEALELVRLAHEAFPTRVFIGWDIALLEGGWHIIEGNAAPDLDIMQRTHEAPLGNARLGELLAFHAAATLRAEARTSGVSHGRK